MSEDKRTWIFPPTLKQVRTQFEVLYSSLYKTADRRKPLMIIGDRGVGKTAFVDLFVEIYTADKRAKVKRLNIASLPENLLVSELFGHKKGAFTGATIDKPGHFKTLGDGGLLILEEVGDISPQIQAKLLTVMEDGEYYPVGETNKPEKAKNIQIIGTTNKPRSAFRDDFYDRFFRFKIPAIYQRRGDILYYIGLIFPQMFLRMQSTETLALMCYNWPGNVREIESFCSNVKWREEATTYFNRVSKINVSLSLEGMQSPLLESLASYEFAILREENEIKREVLKNLYRAYSNLSLTDDGSGFQFYQGYAEWSDKIGAKAVKNINRKLKKYRLALIDIDGLKEMFNGPTFLSFTKKSLLPENIQNAIPKSLLPDNIHDAIMNNEQIEIFDQTYLGFRRFCRLTDQGDRENRNLLFPKDNLQTESEKRIDVYSLKEDELLRDYYNNLLMATNWNVAAVARRADVGESNLRKRLRNWNIVRPSSL